MMGEEPSERSGRLPMGIKSKPSAIPRPTPPRNSPTNLYPTGSSNSRNIMLKPGQRLQGATSFSPLHTPSSMAIRHTGITGVVDGGGGGGGVNNARGKSLAAIAGPMGITIVDVAAPQHPWLVLNYSSSLEDGNTSSRNNIGSSSSGGITTMSFQPCLSTLPTDLSDVDGSASPMYGGGDNGYDSNTQHVLLATARGTGILIWDCSGRALSPLLGRLNASDSWGGGGGNSSIRGIKTTPINNTGNNGGSSKRNNMDEDSMESVDSGTNQSQQQFPPVVVKSDADAFKSMVGSPLSLDRKSSLISVSSTSSLVTSNATNMLGNNNASAATGTSMATTKTSSAAASAAPSSSNKGNVTSLDWKGPSAPILLSTCDNSACIWDLRTSLFSGLGSSGGRGGGARPNARFISPEDNLSHPGSSLIHCAYSRGESKHAFATLDSAGVVRVWDDRKADHPRHSFMACPGGGVGIASIAPSTMSGSVDNDAGPRWATWGMDELHHGHDEDLVVKVWTESSSLTPKSRKNTSSSASTAENRAGAADRNEGDGGGSDAVGTASYNVTSRISMTGAVAARVHPSFPNGIVLFKDNASEHDDVLQQKTAAGGLSTPLTFGASAAEILKEEAATAAAAAVEGLVNSPDQMILAPGLKMRASPNMLALQQTPPSPPSLMLEDASGVDHQDNEKPSSAHDHEGWEAQVWSIDADDSPLVSLDGTNGHCQATFGARKVSDFRGGGTEEDALSFVPGRGDISDVIAVDLALNAPSVDGGNLDANVGKNELSLCVLTESCRLTVYGIPEVELHVQDNRTESISNKQDRVDYANLINRSSSSRVYRQGSADHRGASPWWNMNEEEDLFGDSNTATAPTLQESSSPKKSSMESMRPTAPASVVESDDLSSNKRISQMPENMGEQASSSLTTAVAQSSLIPDAELATSMEDMASERELDTTSGAVASTGDPMHIDPAVAARVPCPPLCGVAFSGVGGIVTFNNGPVKRMWSYYQSNESFMPTASNAKHSNLSNTFPIKPYVKKGSVAISSATSDDDDSSSNNQSLEPGLNRTQQQPIIENQALPRTLADLIEMNLRSQTLQWGDAEQREDGDAPSEDGNSTSSSDGSSSYNDPELMVLESDESGSDDDSEGFYHVVSSKDSTQRESPILFDDYCSQEEEATASAEKFAGLPSLSPSVLITRKHDDIVLNGQSPQLSNLLKLGEVWWLAEDFTTPGSNNNNVQNEKHHGNILEESRGEDDTTFARNSSDPYLSPSPLSGKLARSSSFSPSSKSKHTSMIGNLKKLFAHQLPTAMAPPDQRLMNSKGKQNTAHPDQATDRPNHGLDNNLRGSNKVHLGVYMLENPRTLEAASEQLTFAHKLCVQNAQVCSKCGQKAKANTWTLLAQTIQSIFTFEMDETDGWGGRGDALTTGIIEQILRYYEAAGDFQMLSTIVCVLSFGRDRRSSSRGGGGRYQLLPTLFDKRRYDNYLHRYAALLYGWGVLTVRAEVTKRLAYSTPGGGTETIMKMENYTYEDGISCGKPALLPNSGSDPGVTFMPVCGRCMEPVTAANNVCPKCNEYAFQCAICCSAVRGACTWCPLCGHGGHVDCMMQWFKQQKVCPTGCGCICKVGNPTLPAYPHTNY